jgi:hypothetical protein
MTLHSVSRQHSDRDHVLPSNLQYLQPLKTSYSRLSGLEHVRICEWASPREELV